MSESDDPSQQPDADEIDVEVDVQVSEEASSRGRGRPHMSRPRSSKDVATDSSHSSHIELASLQMAKARQEKIRDALIDQVQSCEAEIQQLEQQIQEKLDDLGLAQKGENDRSKDRDDASDDGFTHEY